VNQGSYSPNDASSPPFKSEEGLRGIFQNRLDLRRRMFETPGSSRAPLPEPVPSREGEVPGPSLDQSVAVADARAPKANRKEQPTEQNHSRHLGPKDPDHLSEIWHEQTQCSGGQDNGLEEADLAGRDRRRSVRYEVQGMSVQLAWPIGGCQTRSRLGPPFPPQPLTPSSTQLASRPRPPREIHAGGTESLQRNGPPASQFVTHQAALVNISQTGLCLTLHLIPPRDRSLWIGYCSSTHRGWTEVVLRSLAEPELGRFVLRMSFVETCPYELFKSAVMNATGVSRIDSR